MNECTGKQKALIAIANQAIKDGKTVLYVSFRQEKPLELDQSVQYQVIKPKPVCHSLIEYKYWDD